MKIYFDTNLGTAAAKFNAGLASLTLLQWPGQQQQGQDLGILGDEGVGDVFPHGSRRGG